MNSKNRVTQLLRILTHIAWYFTLAGGAWFSVAYIGSAFGPWDAVNSVNLGVEWEIEGIEAEDELMIAVEDKNGRLYPIEPLRGKGNVDFNVRGATFGKLALPVALWGVSGFGVALWGLFQQRRLFDNLARGHYFEKTNAKRVRLMAYAVFGLIGMRLLGQIMFESIFVVQTGSHISVSGIEIGISPLLISGLVLLVLSQVLKEAAVLKEEQDLTV